MKILVTGSRDWDDVDRVAEVLQRFVAGTVLVHGGCRGADLICAAVGEQLGFVVRPYPADWLGKGRAAGPMRNQHMLIAEHMNAGDGRINLCLAFHNDLEHSRGTRDMVDRVIRAHIPWVLITSDNLPELP